MTRQRRCKSVPADRALSWKISTLFILPVLLQSQSGCNSTSPEAEQSSITTDGPSIRGEVHAGNVQQASLDSERTMKLRRLTALQINDQLRGREIRPVSSNEPVRVGFVEAFHENGTWVLHRSMRALVTRVGRWHIAEDRLCVTIDGNGRSSCRPVWINSSGQLLIQEVLNQASVPIVLRTTRLNASDS